MPSMGGSATLISAPHLGDLLDVDMSTKTDHCILAWDATAGKYTPLAGVAGDGVGGLRIDHGLVAGDQTAATVPDFHSLYGSTFFGDAPGNNVDSDPVVIIQQRQHITADSDVRQALQIVRWGAVDLGQDYNYPLLELKTTLATAMPHAQIRTIDDSVGMISLGPTGGITAGLEAVPGQGKVAAKGGMAAFNHAAPAVQPAITGALSTVTDAAAKAVLTSILAVLVGTGDASNGTT